MSEKNKKQSLGRTGRIVLFVLLGIASVALLAVAAWKILVVAPDVTGPDKDDTPPVAHPDRNDQPVEEGEAPLNQRKKEYFTFLLLGKDTGGGGNTDTMLLVSYDVPAGTLDAVSIPRDTMINVPWKIKKINSVYASSRGIDGLKTEIGHLTSVTPDFYVAVEWEAIGRIVDALDGVWFDVPYDMDYDDPYQDLYIHQEKGYRLLTGDDAMQVIRWRKNNGESYGIGDSGRRAVQQEFLKALAAQCLQLKNWTKVAEFAEIVFDNVETDIPWNNLLWFAEKAMGLSGDNINFHSLPGNDEGFYYTPSLGANLSYFFADPVGIVELVNAHFNPYTRDISELDLQIMYKNEDASLGVTNGELADPDMAIPSVKPPSKPKPETEPEPEPEPDSEPKPDGGDGAADQEGAADEPNLPNEETGEASEEPLPPEEGQEESPPEESGESELPEGDQPPEEGDQPPEEGEQPPQDGNDA